MMAMKSWVKVWEQC